MLFLPLAVIERLVTGGVAQHTRDRRGRSAPRWSAISGKTFYCFPSCLRKRRASNLTLDLHGPSSQTMTKNIKNSEQSSMRGCATFGCDGMCTDALPNMFRSLCAPRPVFIVSSDVFVLVTAILIQRSQHSKDDPDVSHPGRTQHVRIAAMFPFRLSR